MAQQPQQPTRPKHNEYQNKAGANEVHKEEPTLLRLVPMNLQLS